VGIRTIDEDQDEIVNRESQGLRQIGRINKINVGVHKDGARVLALARRLPGSGSEQMRPRSRQVGELIFFFFLFLFPFSFQGF
jgi:hypothetical protein